MLILSKFPLDEGVASYAGFEKSPIIRQLSFQMRNYTFKVVNNNDK